MAAAAEPRDGRAELLRELVELLPERSRRVLLLYSYEERSVGEVALMLGCPEGTVKTALFRARAVSVGLGIVFFEPLRSLLRRWANAI